jgi:anti-anti-sigma factor
MAPPGMPGPIAPVISALRPEPRWTARAGSAPLPVRCCGKAAGAVNCREFRRVSADRILEVAICGMPVLRPENRPAAAENLVLPQRCVAMAAHGGATTAHDARLPRDAAIRRAGIAASRKGRLMPASPCLAITIHHCGLRSVVRLRGELDASTEDRLRCAIGSALNHSPELLVVDLSELSFMDCSGLSVLVWAHQRLAEQERQLLITGAQPVVQRLIRLTGFDTYLHFSARRPAGLLA